MHKPADRRAPLPQPGEALPLPPPLRLFAAVALALTALAWGLALLARLRGWGFPLSSPIFPRGHTFFDFTTFFDRFSDLHTARFFNGGDRQFSYFAPGVPMYQFFYQFRRIPVRYHRLPGFLVFSATILAGLAIAFASLRRALITRGLSRCTATLFVALTLLTSYPLLFSVERGNFETLLALLITLGIWAFCTGRDTLAALLWGVFGAVKLYPLLLAALFLSRRRYAAFALTVATAVATTLLSLWYIGPTFAIARAGIQQGTNNFLETSTTLAPNALCWDHSAFAAVKLIASRSHTAFAPLLHPFLLGAGALMLVLYFARIRTLPLANQLLILSLCEVLLPPSSFDYTLLELYGAWGALVFLALAAARGARPARALGPALVLLALVFTPGNFASWHGVSYNGQLKCAALLALLALAIAVPFTSDPPHSRHAADGLPS